MASNVEAKLVLLWEDEIRAAARALKAAHEASEEDWPTLAGIAHAACMTALWGVTDDCPLAMLASSEIRRLAGKIEVPPSPPSAEGSPK